DGLPPLPDTEYLLCYDPSSNNELAQVIYQAMESYHNPWQYSPKLTSVLRIWSWVLMVWALD
ncbi:hypothetical protein E2K75_07515, partial [Escherichia coli]